MNAAPAVDFTRRVTVYVVSFSPADDQGGVGGFIWNRDLTTMQASYDDEFRHAASDPNPYMVRLVPITVTDGEAQQITDELEVRTDELESLAPALRQFVPPNTISAHVPTGGLVRRDAHVAARRAPIGYAVMDKQDGVIKRGWLPNLEALLDNVQEVGNWESLEDRVATVAELRDRLAECPDELADFEAACDDCDDLPGSSIRGGLLVLWDTDNASVIGHPAALAAEMVNALEPAFDGLAVTIDGVAYVF